MITYLPRLEDFHKYIYFDIEADSLYPSKIWMMCMSRMDEEEVHSFVGQSEIRRAFDELRGQEVYFVGHNAISCDGPHTARLVGGQANVTNTVDSLVLSYLYDPALTGGHSLKAWGDRLGDPKGDFHDWTGYSPEMEEYCIQDVKLGKKVARALWSRMKRMGFSEMSCEIEHQIREVVDEQQHNGWYFDIPGAQSLVSQLRAEQSALEGPIHELFPARLEVQGTYLRRFTKDGGDYANYVKHVAKYPELRDNGDGSYSTFDWEDFNIGSPIQRVERLLELGWEPENFTPNKTERFPQGFPKVDEEALVAFAETSGRAEAQAIADWLVLQGRASMLDTWLNNVNYDDHCMHGRVFTCGATTRRMTHSSPNTANIPKAKKKVKYGIECRSLWQARPGRREVGYDASGLELRMFAQYLNNPEATVLYTDGDPHLFNTRLLELPDEMRDLTVKNGLYCLLYGGGDAKLGVTLRPELRGREASGYGKWARERLTTRIPGLARLVADIEDEFRGTGGLLRTIDGGLVRCHSKSAAPNYKFQSAGAIVMKVADILSTREIKKRGLDVMKVGTIHDEGQDDTSIGDAETAGQIRVQGIRDAGEYLGFHVPLDGDYKVGLNWATTH